MRLWFFLHLLCFLGVQVQVIDAWFFSCTRGNHNGRLGDRCSLFCQCRQPFICEAFRQRCTRLSSYNEHCHLTKPCNTGLSCQPGIQRCYNSPRRLHQPCSLGYGCDSGLSCSPGFQVCYHHPRHAGEPCSAGYPCHQGLSCHPGLQRCYQAPRGENEPCSIGYGCSRGLSCTLCNAPVPTCQMTQVASLTNQDMQRPYNHMAYLVTHNSYSYGKQFALWARNQRFDIAKQLNDGVRGFMLDIYPGWNKADIRLCHASCFWNGSSNLVDVLIDIRRFLENHPQQIVTLIFEDYIRNSSLLAKVFKQANISQYVLPHTWYGSKFKEWPSLLHMVKSNRRLVVFNSASSDGFPYSENNMWSYVIENRYGSHSQNTQECFERNESEGNGSERNIVLINYFTTIPNLINLCLNDFDKIKQKLLTCRKKFGSWANFLAVDYYKRARNGGAFKAVQWLNQNLQAEKTATNFLKDVLQNAMELK